MTDDEGRAGTEQRLLSAIEHAIEVNISDAGVITGFVVIAEYLDDAGDTCLYADTLTRQSAHRTLGMVEWARIVEQRRIGDHWCQVDDDDDD